MNIFVSGIAGFMGSYFADSMIERGNNVIGCDNLIGGYLDNVPDDAEFFEYDCVDYSLMVQLTQNVDVVVHFAAAPYEGLSVFSPSVITRNIVCASVSLISASIQNRVRRFVYCSSMARYGTNDVPFTEDMEPRPQDPYGIGKVAGEDILRSLCETHGMEFVIAVPHNIIGPRQKYDDPYRNVASIMINLMLQGRHPIIYGDGEQKRCFSFIDDVNWLFEKLVYEKGISGETFNVGPDEQFVTINELANTVAGIIGVDISPLYFPDRPQEVKLANCSSDKIREYFNYSTKVGLEEGLLSMVNYIRDRGVKPFKYHLDLEIISEITPVTWKENIF